MMVAMFAGLGCLLVGTGLGAGFRVWSLLPATMLTVACCAAGQVSPWAWYACIVALQGGYLGGMLMFRTRPAADRAGPARPDMWIAAP